MNESAAESTQQATTQFAPVHTALPQQPVTSDSSDPMEKKFSKKTIIAVIILFVIVAMGGAVLLFLQRSRPEEPAPVPRIVVTTPVPGQIIGTPHYVGFQSITLSDTSGENYTALAYRSVIPSHIFWAVHTTLLDPPEDSFYEMWIGKTEDTYLPTGRLYKNSEGIYSYSLVFGFTFDEQNSFFTNFDELPNKIAVSLEKTGDETMEIKLLEGEFKE